MPDPEDAVEMRSEERTCFLILTTNTNRNTLSFYREIRKATAALGDVVLLYHQTAGPAPVIPGVRIHSFTSSVLHDLGYKPLLEQIVPGSNHFPVLEFYLGHPDYDYYWCIEDDVRFRGNWSDFFRQIHEGVAFDFVTSHLRRRIDEPGWYWWQYVVAPEGESAGEELLASFNPIYRISNGGLLSLHQSLLEGWSGHHEVVMPTIIQRQGLALADLGSVSNQITPLLHFCTLRTMRWKPVVVLKGLQRNKLYHPVKGKWSFAQVKKFLKGWLNGTLNYVME